MATSYRSFLPVLKSSILIVSLLLPWLTFSHPVSCPNQAAGRNLRVIHEFPKPSWLENLAIRRNGSVLATEMTHPRLWQINPFNTKEEPWLIHTFPGYLGALGIVEIEEDIFAVVTGNFSLRPGPKSFPGTYTAWKVNLRSKSESAGTGCPRVEKIADFPQAAFLNGLTFLPKPANSLMLADSEQGLVYRYNLTTKKLDIALDSPLMKKCAPDLLEGINGLRLHGDELYFTNGFCGTLCKVPIYPNGTARDNSSGEIIARTSSTKYIFDDLAVAPDGTTYVATGYENIITRVAPNGVANVFAGDLNSTALLQPTAAALGRTMRDSRTLYVTTCGRRDDSTKGIVGVGAQLVAIDL